MNPWKKSIEERVARFKQFYRKQNDRPLLGFFYGSEYPVHRYETGRTIPVGRTLIPAGFPVEPYLDDYDRLFDLHEACGGDFIWSASIFWGIPWVEAALGCSIQLSSYESGLIHAEKPVDFRNADDISAFSMDNNWVVKAVEFLEKSAARSSGRYPLATTRMRGISDLLAVLYGEQELIFTMMSNPDEIKQAADRLGDFWIAFGKMQIDRIPLFHDGIGSFYYNAWAPKGTIWHQEDAVALLSPDLFDRFIRDVDDRIASTFEGCIMHQHSTGYVPIDYYLEMDFTALELHIDTNGPSAEQLFDMHKKIIAKKPLLIWGDIPDADLDWIFFEAAAREIVCPNGC